jgi:hypothetical protein
MDAVLEWQFYIEELRLILVPDGKRYVSLDDPSRTFEVVEHSTADE